MCRPAPFSFSLPLRGGGIEGEGAKYFNLIISDRGDEALLHLERSDC